MKKTLLGFTTFLILIVANGQAQITFQKTYGGTNDEWANSIQQTTDSGYVITGYTQSFGGGFAFYLLKTKANGDTLWTKTFGGTADDQGKFVQPTSDGGYIAVGETNSFGAGGFDIYLIKTNGNGNFLWTKTFGGTGSDYGYSVQQTSDGGYIVVGETSSFGAGSNDVYLIRTDGNGDTLWTKTFGGTSSDYGYSVQQTTEGGYVIAGNFSFGGNDDAYLIKTDANGNSLWTKTFGGTSSENGRSVRQITDGGYVIAGHTRSFGAGLYDVYVIKTDGNGNTLWTKTFGGTSSDYGYSIQQTSDGGYIVVGEASSFGAGSHDAYLIKADGNGNYLWSKTFGSISNDYGYSIQHSSDGGYVLAGYTRSFGAGGNDIYIVKTNNNGNSGCSESNPATITTTPTTTVTNPVTQVSSGGIVGNSVTQTGNGGITTTLCITVGVGEIQQLNPVSIFPNPFFTQTTLQSDKIFKDATLTTYNLYGQAIKQIKNISGRTATLFRDNLPCGLYLIRITQDNTIIATDKLMITDN